jgi:hypothetical protein
MPNRKMPADERLMDTTCEYILELRIERIWSFTVGKRYNVNRLRRISTP